MACLKPSKQTYAVLRLFNLSPRLNSPNFRIQLPIFALPQRPSKGLKCPFPKGKKVKVQMFKVSHAAIRLHLGTMAVRMYPCPYSRCPSECKVEVQ